MAKPQTPNQKKAYNALNTRLNRYVARVQGIYDKLNQQAATIAQATGYQGGTPFHFSDYPEVAKMVNDLMGDFVGGLQNLIYAGTTDEWKQSNIMQDLLAKKVMRYYDAQIDGEKQRVYFQSNSDALKAFQQRTERGMNLSTKLWDQSGNYKQELEYAISSAIEKGTSAVTLSKQLSQYLNDFPSLKADYTNMFGHAVDCHDCEYRSIRLARSEINMAYRTAEQTRWRQFDFILGYEIKLSGSHPAEDICDSLAGRYPKDFVWTGWHPNDMCYSVPIVMSEEQYWGMREGNGRGQDDMVKDVPNGFKQWVGENKPKIDAAKENGTLPYWLRDNESFIPKTIKEAAELRHASRTQEKIDEIRHAWNNRKQIYDAGDNWQLFSLRREAKYLGYDISELETFVRSGNLGYDKYGTSTKLENLFDRHSKALQIVREETNASFSNLKKLLRSLRSNVGPYQFVEIQGMIEEAIKGYSPYKTSSAVTYTKEKFDMAYRKASRSLRKAYNKLNEENMAELEKALGIKAGHPMSFKEADEGRGNINYNRGKEYSINCQICVVADELRRRGFNVTALGRIEGQGIADKIATNTTRPWIDAHTGHHPRKKIISMIGINDNEVYGKISDATIKKGRYHIDFVWNGGEKAHIACVERQANGMLRLYDPQSGKKYDLLDWISKMDKRYTVNVLRVDNLNIASNIIQEIVEPLK